MRSVAGPLAPWLFVLLLSLPAGSAPLLEREPAPRRVHLVYQTPWEWADLFLEEGRYSLVYGWTSCSENLSGALQLVTCQSWGGYLPDDEILILTDGSLGTVIPLSLSRRGGGWWPAGHGPAAGSGSCANTMDEIERELLARRRRRLRPTVFPTCPPR